MNILFNDFFTLIKIIFGIAYLILIFGILPLALSWPAIRILKKRNKWTIIDYGINIYSVSLWWILTCANLPTVAFKGLSNYAADPVAITLISIMVNYIRLLLPIKLSKWIISTSNIILMLIIATIIYFWLPSLGE